MAASGHAGRPRARQWLVVLVGAVALALLGTVLLARATFEARSPQPVHFLVGAALTDNGDPSALEAEAGAHLGIRRTFWNRAKLAQSVQVARDDIAAGRVPLLSYKVHDRSGADRASVEAWARTAADQLSALGGRVMVAIHHEPEGDGDITAWTALQKRLAPLFDRPNLEFGVILTGYNQFYGPREFSLDALWPDGAPIRFLGLDVYQSFGAVNQRTGRMKGHWTNLEHAYFKRVQAFAAQKKVAWGLAETGITDRAWRERPEARHWFATTIQGIARHGGTFFSYFDSSQNSGSNTWPLHGSKKRAFLDAVAHPPTSVVVE